MNLQNNYTNNQINDVDNPDNDTNEIQQVSQNLNAQSKFTKNLRLLFILGIVVLLLLTAIIVIIYNPFRSPDYPSSIQIQKNTELAINSLNGNSDKDAKLKYSSYEIYFQEGENGSSHGVAYPEYDLMVYDTKNNNSKTITSTFDDNVAINSGKLYYFVENFNNNGKRFFEYNLTTGESTDLNNPYEDIGIYSIVSSGNELYFGVNNSPIGSSEYGVFSYNIATKQYIKFSELDIRYLDENFLPVDDGFLTSIDDKILLINSSKNDSIKFKLTESYYQLSNEIYLPEKPNTVCFAIIGAAKGETYLTAVGNVCLDTSKDYKVVSYNIE